LVTRKTAGGLCGAKTRGRGEDPGTAKTKGTGEDKGDGRKHGDRRLCPRGAEGQRLIRERLRALGQSRQSPCFRDVSAGRRPAEPGTFGFV